MRITTEPPSLPALQAEWRMAANNPAWQRAIAEQLADHPGWNITIGVQGPEQGKLDPNALQAILEATQPPKRIPLPVCDPVLSRLARFQAEWRAASEAGRRAITEQIAEHPEWGFVIGENGPEEMEF